MARPAQFDRDEALDKALHVFWRQGYTVTSMPQLLQAMDIRPSSFYSSFGSKRDLYTECFKQYTRAMQNLVDSISQSHDPLWAVENYFAVMFSNGNEARLSNGCLVVNTAIEMEGIDSELCQLAAAQLQKVEQAFAQCFANAQAAGRMRSDMSAASLAQFFGTVNAGIRVKLRTGANTASLLEQVDSLIQFLGIDRSSVKESS